MRTGFLAQSARKRSSIARVARPNAKEHPEWGALLRLEAPPRIELGIEVLQTCALPLGHGALWSGLRGLNPPPRPWQGRALPNELNPHISGASGRNRTNDTGIFSPLLYQLSYRGMFQKNRTEPVQIFLPHFGDPKGTRTPDL